MFPIWVPPLRDRLADVPELARHFLTQFAAEEGKRIAAIDDEAIDLITAYSWPGNVRQLENAVFRAVVLADGDSLTVAEFPQIATHVQGFRAEVPAAPIHNAHKKPAYDGPVVLGIENIVPRTVEIPAGVPGMPSLGLPIETAEGEIRSLESIEADMIRLALARYRGHMTEVAKRLKIGRSTLYRKMRDYGLEERAN